MEKEEVLFCTDFFKRMSESQSIEEEIRIHFLIFANTKTVRVMDILENLISVSNVLKKSLLDDYPKLFNMLKKQTIVEIQTVSPVNLPEEVAEVISTYLDVNDMCVFMEATYNWLN